MDLTLEDIGKLSKDLIDRYFISLQPISIIISEEKENDNFFAATSVIAHKSQYKIKINSEIFKMNLPAIKGCLAHEFAHIEIINKKSGFKYFTHMLMVKVNDEYHINDERLTDELVIKKGLGNELLAFQNYHDRNYEKYDESDGLTKKEIKQHIIKH